MIEFSCEVRQGMQRTTLTPTVANTITVSIGIQSNNKHKEVYSIECYHTPDGLATIRVYDADGTMRDIAVTGVTEE